MKKEKRNRDKNCTILKTIALSAPTWVAPSPRPSLLCVQDQMFRPFFTCCYFGLRVSLCNNSRCLFFTLWFQSFCFSFLTDESNRKRVKGQTVWGARGGGKSWKFWSVSQLINTADIFSSCKAVHDIELTVHDFFLVLVCCINVFFNIFQLSPPPPSPPRPPKQKKAKRSAPLLNDFNEWFILILMQSWSWFETGDWRLYLCAVTRYHFLNVTRRTQWF